jgi:hypothetical protein
MEWLGTNCGSCGSGSKAGGGEKIVLHSGNNRLYLSLIANITPMKKYPIFE